MHYLHKNRRVQKTGGPISREGKWNLCFFCLVRKKHAAKEKLNEAKTHERKKNGQREKKGHLL